MPDAAPLKFGTLTGSLRAAAWSGLLARCLPGLAPEGVSVTALPCVGELPHFDQDVMDAGLPDSVVTLGAAIDAVDGVILCSPEYNWSIPGALKNALDWMSRLKPLPFKDKPVLIATTSPGLLGGARAHAPIRNVLHSLEARILVKPEIQIAQVASKLDAQAQVSDAATADFLRQRLADFAVFTRR